MIIKSYIDSPATLINLSATIFVPLDAKIFVDLPTEATTTSTFARLSISTIVTNSISCVPLATGMRTCTFKVRISHYNSVEKKINKSLSLTAQALYNTSSSAT